MKVFQFNIHDIVKFEIVDEVGGPKWGPWKNIFEEYENFISKDLIDEDELDFCFRIVKKISPRRDCYLLDDKYFVEDGYLYTTGSYKLANWKIELVLNDARQSVRLVANSYARLFITGFFVDFMIQHSLIRKGYSVIHSSAISRDGVSYLFSGRGGSGKTSLSMSYISSDDAYRYLGDDFTIVHDGFAVPFVTPLNLFYYNVDSFIRSRLSRDEMTSLSLRKALYLVTRGYAKFFVRVNPMKIFPDIVGDSSRISKVFILLPLYVDDDSLSQVKRISKMEAVKHLRYNMIMDSPYLPVYSIEYGYLFPKHSFARHFEMYDESLLANLRSDAKYYKIDTPVHPNWIELRRRLSEVINEE